MARATHVYFPDELSDKINSLPRGELSRICQNAVLEHFNLRDKTPEELEAEIKQLNHEKEIMDKKEEFLKKKLQEAYIKKVETEKNQVKNKKKKADLIEKGKESFFWYAKEICQIEDESIITSAYEEYLLLKQKKDISSSNFLNEKFPKPVEQELIS